METIACYCIQFIHRHIIRYDFAVKTITKNEIKFVGTVCWHTSQMPVKACESSNPTGISLMFSLLYIFFASLTLIGVSAGLLRLYLEKHTLGTINDSHILHTSY